jgi:HSP20 family molecular chaperone IbpA
MNRPQDLARREAPWGAPTDREPRQRVPAYAVYDEGEEITVEFELPGVPAEDIEINGFRDRIRIEAERGLESSERQGIAGATGPTRFQLEAPLQLEVEPTEAVARLEDGLLSVVLPKANPNQGIASIPVQD